MITLILAILSTSYIFFLFKLFPKYQINTFQAIVFNYVSACICGLLISKSQLNSQFIQPGNWIIYAFICGGLFISIFYLMGISSQKNGIALTSVAVKMSMALSMLVMIVLYKESVSFLKICGIATGFVGVFLMAYQKSEKNTEKNYTWMLVILFIGCSLLDLILNRVQKLELSILPSSLFSAFGFGIAGIIGFLIIGIQLIAKKQNFHFNSLIAGILLGIPNYFSIFLLLESYQSTGWSDSTVLAIMNISVVLISAIIGFLVFKENSNQRKLTGLVLSVLAIILLFIASNP